MTKKTLSQKICEECGIEYEQEVIDPLYKELCNDGDPRCSQIKSTRKEKIDFESKNFVKLFNLKYSEFANDTVSNFLFLRYRNVISTRSFLVCLLFELQHGKCKKVEKIKQAIREADWE